MSSVNKPSEQMENILSEFSTFDKLVVLLKQSLPKHVDAIIASDAYIAMNKLKSFAERE